MVEETLPTKNEDSILAEISESLQGKIVKVFSWIGTEEGKIVSRAIASLASFGIGDPTGMIFPLILKSTEVRVRKRLLKHVPDFIDRLEKEKIRINKNFFNSETGQELLRNTFREFLNQKDEEKIEYHKTFLLNSYVEQDPNEELISSYWDILISLSTTSLLILKVLINPEKKAVEIFEYKKGKDEGDYFSYSLKTDLIKVLGINESVFNRASTKLESEGLINTTGTSVNWSEARYHEYQFENYYKRVSDDARRLVTDYGKNFYKFVMTKK